MLSKEHEQKLRVAYPTSWECDCVEGLLSAQASGLLPRGGFFEKLADQVLDWLEEDEPKYRTPLSNAQFAKVEKEGF